MVELVLVTKPNILVATSLVKPDVDGYIPVRVANILSHCCQHVTEEHTLP